jgi:pSer/pThr/pTyr-binding forkhead associated (FHA) protein
MQLDSKKVRELIKLNKFKDQEINDSSKTNITKRRKLVVMLSYLSGNKEPIQLTKKSIKIGKDVKSDVLVKGFGVGKTAAVINKVANFWYISYVEGLSKPRVNSAALKKTLKLNNLDIITIGSTKLQVLFDFQN